MVNGNEAICACAGGGVIRSNRENALEDAFSHVAPAAGLINTPTYKTQHFSTTRGYQKSLGLYSRAGHVQSAYNLYVSSPLSPTLFRLSFPPSAIPPSLGRHLRSKPWTRRIQQFFRPLFAVALSSSMSEDSTAPVSLESFQLSICFANDIIIFRRRLILPSGVPTLPRSYSFLSAALAIITPSASSGTTLCVLVSSQSLTIHQPQ